ncbi:MAG: S8/S53 family peptidase [Dongiaceae bacterium]
MPAQQNDWNVRYSRLDRALAMMPRRVDGHVAWGNLRVAHLDTGYRRHPALGFPASASGESPWVKHTLGRDFFDNKTDPKDPLVDTPWQPPGHGTRTASALTGDDAQIVGLAPRLPIVPYRVNDHSLIGTQAVRAIGRAIRDAIDRNNCKIVTISLGFPVLFDGEMGEAVDYAYENGVIVVAACGQMTNKVSYPGKHRRTIGVGGVWKRPPGYRLYYEYENYARVDIFAPAKFVWRADVDCDDDGSFLSWTYGEGDGTSYAVPHVVATAAMWLTHRGPEINAKYGATWKRVEVFRKLLRLTQRVLLFKAPPDCMARALDAEALLKRALPTVDDTDYDADRAEDDRV